MDSFSRVLVALTATMVLVAACGPPAPASRSSSGSTAVATSSPATNPSPTPLQLEPGEHICVYDQIPLASAASAGEPASLAPGLYRIVAVTALSDDHGVSILVTLAGPSGSGTVDLSDLSPPAAQVWGPGVSCGPPGI